MSHNLQSRRGSRTGRLTPPQKHESRTPTRKRKDSTKIWEPTFGIVFTEDESHDQTRSERRSSEPKGLLNGNGVNFVSSTDGHGQKIEESKLDGVALTVSPTTGPKAASATETSPKKGKRIRPGWGPYVPVQKRQLSTATQPTSNDQTSSFTVSETITVTETIEFNDAPSGIIPHSRASSPSPKRCDESYSKLYFTSDATQPANTTFEQVGNSLEAVLKGTTTSKQQKFYNTPPPSLLVSPSRGTREVPDRSVTPETETAMMGGVALPTDPAPKINSETHAPSSPVQSIITKTVATEICRDSTAMPLTDTRRRKSQWAKEPSKPRKTELEEAEFGNAPELQLTDGSDISDDFFGVEGTQAVFDMDELHAILEPDSDSGPEVKTKKGKSKRKKQELEAGEHYLSDSSLSSESASSTSTLCEWEADAVSTVSVEAYVPLNYQIPSATWEEKERQKKENPGTVFWSHDWYEDHNGKKVEVVVCDTAESCEETAKRFLKEEALGFDLEWFIRPSQCPWKNVSLIQLASEDCIALFRLAAIGKRNEDNCSRDDLVAPTLRAILESKEILKVGVAVAGDGSRIRRWLGINPQALLELGSLHSVNECYKAKKKNIKISQRPVALATLCEIYLKFPLSKGVVRVSDWTRERLNSDQVSYAATDAYSGLRIYDRLQEIRKNLNPVPPMPPFVKPQAMTNKQKRKCAISPELALKLPGLDGPKQKAAMLLQGTNNSEKLTPPRVPKPRKKPGLPKQPLSPELEMATEWERGYRLKHPNTSFSPSQLKAYALWHHGEHTIDEIIRFWPVQDSYLARLVQQVVKNKFEVEMEYKKERYWSEIHPRVEYGYKK